MRALDFVTIFATHAQHASEAVAHVRKPSLTEYLEGGLLTVAVQMFSVDHLAQFPLQSSSQ